MSRTPTTPFIPPLLTPNHSPNPQPSPVIPGLNAPGPPGSYPAFQSQGPPGNYPVYPAHSPFTASPFIPPSPSAYENGGLPGGAPPPAPSRQNSRQGVSADYTGYPQGAYPFTPQTAPGAAIPPPMNAGYYPHTPLTPHHPGFNSAPGPYSTFMQAGQGTPWAPPMQMHSPYQPQPQSARIPPPAAAGMYHTPYSPFNALPHQQPAWGAPHPSPAFYPQNPLHDPWYGQQAHPLPGHNPYGQVVPEPPSHFLDRMDPFAEGNHYGPVLDPFLVKVVHAQVQLNPLISPQLDDKPDQPYLKWNMLFTTAMITRSDDPQHVSWANGRNAPATFPRLTSLRLIGKYFPWMIEVKAKDKDRGVTCGEVIEAIWEDMHRLSHRQDYENLPPREKAEVSHAYRHNRSPSNGVPGGILGQGMKRLDFLRIYTSFGGIERNDAFVKNACGVVLPCVFVLKCMERFVTDRDLHEQEARMRHAQQSQRVASRNGQRSASRNPGGARSRASSVNARISVQSPSTSSMTDYSEED